ncbi:hypothetical protein [Streptomyces lavendofoliae]|uniref:Uncharacterized protein n=1 Tax=Streptomyces lavendofoliae TaxID=67314 RepID=A0A918HZW9_9ACTN|nr:hypothetical protein [Streptomyces lavendofoliae]GGU50342.1 hypothetical protein GCM10010274_43810 [Streptomyces lavendofoliae]
MTDTARDDTTGPKRSAPARLLIAAGHRWPTLLAVALAVATFADGLPGLAFLAWLLFVMPVCYLLFGAARGEFRPRGALARQLYGLLAFGTVALLALALDDTLARYLLAAGWLGHAAWDFAHRRTGRVVPRAWSEWCCVVDLLGAVALLALA